MTLDELAGLLRASRFLPRGEPVERAALRAVPELADGLPPVVFDARGPDVWSGSADVLKAPLRQLGAAMLAEVRRVGPGVDHNLADDPLVVLLARLMVEGAGYSPGAAVVPLLEAMRGAWAALTEPGLRDLHQADPAGAGCRVAQSVQARLAAACAKASVEVRVPALAWAITRSRLLPLFPRGSLDRDPSWARIASVLGVPLPTGTIGALETAVRLVVVGVLERRAGNRLTADDSALVLRALPPARLDAGPDVATAALLVDPDGLIALLPILGRFVDQRALVAANVEAAQAARLLTTEGGLAVASVMLELLAALRVWDVLSQLVAAVRAPPLGVFVVPRGAPTVGAVVAVGLGRLRADPSGASVHEAAWSELVRATEDGVVADLGVAGIAVFPDAVDALRFALLARRRLEGVALAMSYGSIVGGTDGAVTRLSGPAVEAALRWVALPPPPTRNATEDPVVRLRQVGGWLCGSGLAIDAAADSALIEARVRRGLATRVEGPPGGDPRVLHSLDVFRAYEFDGAVLVIVRISGILGGFEAVLMSGVEWSELLDRDSERPEPSSTQSIAVPAPIAFSAPLQAQEFPSDPTAAEEAHGWEMTEPDEDSDQVPVLDLEEMTFDSPPPSPAQTRFEFDEAGSDVATLGDASSSFSGFYLPGTATVADRPLITVARAAPVLASFDIEFEDEEEETHDWGPPPDSVPDQPSRPEPPRLSDVQADHYVSFSVGDHFPVSDDQLEIAPARVPEDPATPTTPHAHAEAVDEGTFSFNEPNAPPASLPPGTTPAEADASGVTEVHSSRSISRSVDFDFLLKGYACFFDRKEAVFGRPYGTRIVDRHVYPYHGDPDEVYSAFLRDKIREGFVPLSERIGDLPRGVTVMPLDVESMQRAWRELS